MGFNDVVVPHYTYTLHMHWHFVVFSVIPRWQCKRFDHEAQTTVWLYNNNHNITWYQYEYMIFFYYISSVELRDDRFRYMLWTFRRRKNNIHPQNNDKTHGETMTTNEFHSTHWEKNHIREMFVCVTRFCILVLLSWIVIIFVKIPVSQKNWKKIIKILFIIILFLLLYIFEQAHRYILILV